MLRVNIVFNLVDERKCTSLRCTLPLFISYFVVAPLSHDLVFLCKQACENMLPIIPRSESKRPWQAIHVNGLNSLRLELVVKSSILGKVFVFDKPPFDGAQGMEIALSPACSVRALTTGQHAVSIHSFHC